MSEQSILDVPATPEASAEVTTEVPATPQGTLLSDPAGNGGVDFIPEAFRVFNGDQLDVNASARQLADAYNARAQFGTIPGESEEYAPVEGLASPWEEVKNLDAVKGFQAEARKLGFTNEQFAFALKNIASAELDGRNYSLEHQRQTNEETLRKAWAEPGAFETNLKHAGNALRVLVPADSREAFSQKYGNDADIIQLLARVGAEISEDVAEGLTAPIPTTEDVKSLMASEAYQDSKHPQHKQVMAKVQRYYAKEFGTEATF